MGCFTQWRGSKQVQFYCEECLTYQQKTKAASFCITICALFWQNCHLILFFSFCSIFYDQFLNHKISRHSRLKESSHKRKLYFSKCNYIGPSVLGHWFFSLEAKVPSLKGTLQILITMFSPKAHRLLARILGRSSSSLGVYDRCYDTQKRRISHDNHNKRPSNLYQYQTYIQSNNMDRNKISR